MVKVGMSKSLAFLVYGYLLVVSILVFLGLVPIIFEPALYALLAIFITIFLPKQPYWNKEYFSIFLCISVYRFMAFCFNSFDYSHLFDILRVFIIFTILSFCSQNSFIERRKLLLITHRFLFLLGLFFLISGISVGNLFSSEGAEAALTRIGLFSRINETTFAGLMLLLFMSSAALMYFKFSYIYIASFLLVVINILLLAKSGFLISILLASVYFCAFVVNKNLYIIGILIFVLAMSYFLFYLDYSLLPQLDLILSFRGSIWESAFEDFHSAGFMEQLFGLGQEYIPSIVKPYSDVRTFESFSLHNAYLRLLVQEGYLGFSVLMLVTINMMIRYYKSASFEFKKTAVVLISIFFFSKITDGSFFYKTSYYFEFVFIYIFLNPSIFNNPLKTNYEKISIDS